MPSKIRMVQSNKKSNMDAAKTNSHNPIKITMIFFLNLILGNEDTFQDDGSKNPLNVRIIYTFV